MIFSVRGATATAKKYGDTRNILYTIYFGSQIAKYLRTFEGGCSYNEIRIRDVTCCCCCFAEKCKHVCKHVLIFNI